MKMPAEVNYKNKYLELRNKYIADLDMAYRLGFEAGGQQAQQQQAIETDAQNQQAEMQRQGLQAEAMGQNGAPKENEMGAHVGGQPGKVSENPSQEGQPMNGTSGNGSEIDQHISKLQGMLGKGHSPQIQKSLDAIIDLRKKEKLAQDLQKSQEAISGIAKALHKPAFKVGAQASHNMDDNAKRSLSLQHKIVSDVMKSWQEEEAKAGSDIKNILKIDGVLGE